MTELRPRQILMTNMVAVDCPRQLSYTNTRIECLVVLIATIAAIFVFSLFQSLVYVLNAFTWAVFSYIRNHGEMVKLIPILISD